MIRTLCIAALVSAALPARAQPKGPFEVRSGILESMIEGLGEGHVILYFDDFGRQQATYTNNSVDLGGQRLVTHSLKIDLADGTSYDIDLDKKTGTRMKMPPGAEKVLMAVGIAVSEQMKREMKVKDLPDKEFLGKRCKGVHVETMGVKAWTWKGLTLYSETGSGGSPFIIKATKLAVDVPVPAEKFKVPAGVKIEDVSG